MNTLLNHALAYAERGWSILPIGKNKQPALGSWKEYQTRRPTEAELRGWFAKPNVTGLAVVCGEASGGLVVRDFDVAGSYEKWAGECPELAKTLPTAKTGRGHHVYFVNGHRGIKKLEDGELRGAGYVVLPPSIHPSGKVYSWLVALPDGLLPEINPFECGLSVAETKNQDLVGALEESSCPSDREDGDDRENREMASALSALSVRLDAPDIKRAIESTIPRGPRHRNTQVFELARALKAIPSVADADVTAFRDVARKWHRLASPFIGTKPFEDTWAEFVYAWPRVKYPKGTGPMPDILKRADASDVPSVAAGYDSPDTHRLIKLCRELQRASGDEPFFLSCRMAADLLGIDRDTAWRRLKALVADRILKVIAPGTKTRATRYLYLAGRRMKAEAPT